MSGRFTSTRGRERGFTLVEVVIAAGLIALVAAGAYETLAAQPAQTAATITSFDGLIARARALATIDAGAAGGATLGVERDGDLTTVTLYAGRPVRGAAPPQALAEIPPLRASTPIALAGAASSATTFALFFSPGGHVSAAEGDRPGTSPALAAEPSCPLETGIALTFGSPPHAQSRVVSCAFGILDGADASASR